MNPTWDSDPNRLPFSDMLSVFFAWRDSRHQISRTATDPRGSDEKNKRLYSGYPWHRENREKSLSGKTQGIWKCCQNTGKTQGIWFAQVVNSLILTLKRYFYICPENFKFFFKFEKSAKSVLWM